MTRLKNADASVWAGLPLVRKKTLFPLITGIIFGIGFLILAATILSFTLPSPAKAPADINLEPGNPAASDITGQITIPDNTYITSMNNDWYFDDGVSPSSNAYVENTSENSHTVYFEIILSDTGETVYSSPYIPVGSTLEHPALSVNLDAGDYNGTCLYHLVDDNNTELSTVTAYVTLHILN
ncbi:MAG: hypothetical protein NC086_03290 [Alistipes sp.]|nr:hypothetical protein [Alistipes sp.]